VVSLAPGGVVVPGWCEPPEVLPIGAAPFWRSLVLEMLAQGLTPAQIPTVFVAVTSDWHMRQAAALVTEHGMLVQGMNGPVANPAFRMWKDASAVWLRAAAELGLTTAARMRLGLMQLQGESLMASLNRDLDAR
jgi:P27 family predicted phage terminase small subunit